MNAKRPAILLIFLASAIVAGLVPCPFALGSVEQPGGVAARRAASAGSGSRAQHPRGLTSYYQSSSSVFARLRPVDREEPIDFDEATALLQDKTTNEKIFNKDFESKMRDEYANRVSPLEKSATNPLWRPSYYEVQRYESGRKELAQWTTREVMEDQLKDFFAHGDKDSAGMKVMSTARALTGGEEETKDKAPSAQEKAARAHRTDLAQAPAEEEKIPTKLKTKLNVLRQNGSIVFSNPIAIASVNGSKDQISADINKEFSKLTLKSKVAYGVKDECLNVNVRKKVTDQISLDLDHYTYTGDKRDAAGYKVKEQAKVNYSISF